VRKGIGSETQQNSLYKQFPPQPALVGRWSKHRCAASEPVQAQTRSIGVWSLVLVVGGEERRVTLSSSSFITPGPAIVVARPVYTYILASRLVITPSHLSREQSRCKYPLPPRYRRSKSAEVHHNTQQQATQPAGLLDYQRSFAAGALPAPAAHFSG
jgi:hypothetical protein